MDEKLGYLVASFFDDLPAGITTSFYASTRDWAKSHADAAKGFRDAINEADQFVAQHPAESREILGKYIKVPPAVLAEMVMPHLMPRITAAQMKFWTDAMMQQGTLKNKLDVNALIGP
jgi:NitT/TauT family transport system substrate-binding protein